MTYVKTGTTGTVVRLVEAGGKVWAELDTTGLLYDESVLEPVPESARIAVASAPDGEKDGHEQGREESRRRSRGRGRRSRDGGREGTKGEGGEEREGAAPRGEGAMDTSGNICGAG